VVASVNRPEQSLRAARIADTEDRILTAAHAIFVRDGYAATTLSAVADHARVGHRTVYVRFGTKASLLKRVVDVAVAGDREPVPVADRQWHVAALTAATLDERIDHYVQGAADLMARAGDVIAVAQQAEALEPLIADAGRAGRAATRDSLTTFVDKLYQDRLISRQVDKEWAAQTLSILGQAQTYVLMREIHGWGNDEYRSWLRATVHRLVEARLS
jgi:AcrR family transcriptional regulator